MRIISALAAIFLMITTPARADETAMAAAVDRALEQMILPAYKSFASHGAGLKTAVDVLCETPSAPNLMEAKVAFGATAMAFARIEAFRFGPARRDNRFERIFYWPDHRGRGRRQVAGILSAKDVSAIDPITLKSKSVAVQGLPAMAVVLYGPGNAELLSDKQSFDCQYAAAIAVLLRDVGDAFYAEWRDAFAAQMRSPSQTNPFVRSHAEALQLLLKAAREQVQVVADFKIKRIVGAEGHRPNPRAAPLPGTDLALSMTVANLQAVADLTAALHLTKLLPEAHKALPSEADFYLNAGRTALVNAMKVGTSWPVILADVEAQKRAAYAAFPLPDFVDLYAERMPAALGLIAGFNSLDGD